MRSVYYGPRHSNSFLGVLAPFVFVTMVLVPKMFQTSVQMGQENASSARYAMAKTLGKMLKC